MTAFKFTPAEEKQIMAESQADLLLYKPLPKFRELEKILRDLVTKTEAKRKSENQADEETTPPAR